MIGHLTSRIQALPEKTLARIALSAGVICIGFSAIFVRLANTHGDIIGFYRMGIAAVVITVPVIIRWQQGKVRVNWSGILWSGLAGIAFATDLNLWHQAIYMTTASNATLLGNLAPVWVGLAAWLLLGETLRRRYWLGLVLALLGSAVIVGFDALAGLDTNIGNLFALVASMAYAAYQIMTKAARRDVDSLTHLWTFTLVSTAVLYLITLFNGHPVREIAPGSLLWVALLALIPHVVGWMLLTYAFGKLNASLVTVSLLGQPVVTALVALPVLGEIPTLWHIVGSLIVMSGIFMVHRSQNADK